MSQIVFFIQGTKKKITWKDNKFNFLFLYLETFICRGDCDVWISLHASFDYNVLNFLLVHRLHSHTLEENPTPLRYTDFFFFHSHLWSLLCSFFSLYLISPPCLLLCYRPVWLTGLRSAFSQRCEDRLCSNWRYRNAIFQCCGTWFTLYFHLTCVELVSLWGWSHFICIDKSPESFHYLKNMCQGYTDSNLALDPREISEKSTP